MMRLGQRIVRSDALRRLLCAVIALYIRLVYATSRWTIEGGAAAQRHFLHKRPFILAFWHGRLLMMPMAWPREVPIHMLISGHRDGRIIADAVGHFGIASIAGSSSRGGLAALRAMVKTLKDGACVGITPDGPRGPAMQASAGIVAAARLAQVPIIPLAYATKRRRVMKTWDRFHLAFPFTTGIHLWGEPIDVPADANEATLARYRQEVEDSLNALGREADRRMGHENEDLPLPTGEGRGEGNAPQPPEAPACTDTDLTLPPPASSRQSSALPDATAGISDSRESGRGIETMSREKLEGESVRSGGR